jgi:hypothetical protein
MANVGDVAVQTQVNVPVQNSNAAAARRAMESALTSASASTTPSKTPAMPGHPAQASSLKLWRSLPKLESVPPFMWVGAGVVALVGIVAGLARAAESTAALDASSQQAVRTCMRNARKCCAAASNTQLSSAQRLAEAEAGLAYVTAARALAPSDTQLGQLCGFRPQEVREMLMFHRRSLMAAARS